MDSSLRGFVNEVHPIGNCFRNDIEVSGKILLLHKLLQEVKEKQLRVLIVFQVCDLNSLILLLYLTYLIVCGGVTDSPWVMKSNIICDIWWFLNYQLSGCFFNHCVFLTVPFLVTLVFC